MTLPAGSHGFPLAVVHADMTPAELRAHLHEHHGGAPHPRLGAAAAQKAHRMKHEAKAEGDRL